MDADVALRYVASVHTVVSSVYRRPCHVLVSVVVYSAIRPPIDLLSDRVLAYVDAIL